MLASLAEKASLANTPKRGPRSEPCVFAQDCRRLLQERILGHNSSLFKTFAFQLAVWTAADPQGLQQNTIQGIDSSDELLQPHVLCLVHFQEEAQQQAPLPWTCAYTIFHAAVLAECASGLREIQREDPWYLGRESGLAEPSPALQSVPAQLASFSRMFRGLQDLALLYDQITCQQRGHAMVCDVPLQYASAR